MAEKKQTKIESSGKVFITSTFNNTLVAVTSDTGNVVAWSSSGAAGFKGTRKSTPYAAGSAVEGAVKKAFEKGLRTVDV